MAPSPYEFKSSPYSSHSLLLAMLPARGEGLRVLDVGCGSGYLGDILRRRGYQVTGIEHPERAPAGAIPANLDEGLPPLDGGFDYILCGDILEHLRDPLRMLQRLRTLGRRIIASLPNSGHAYFRWNVLRGRFPQHDRGLFDRTHLHFYTWSGWVDLFVRGGFRIDRVACSGVPVGFALPRWRDTLAVRAMERISYDLARVWKTLFAYQFIVSVYAVEA